MSVTTDIDWNYSFDTGVFDYLKANYNILQGIQSITKELPMKLSVMWIKGHQDDTKPWHELSHAAKANIYADRTCSNIRLQPTRTMGSFPKWIPGTKAGLLHNG